MFFKRNPRYCCTIVQVEAMAADEGLQIAGYYAAAENFNENSIEKVPGARLADKISEQLGNAVCVMVLKSLIFFHTTYT